MEGSFQGRQADGLGPYVRCVRTMGGRVTENNQQGESTKMPPMTRFCGERIAMLIHLKNILLGGDRVGRCS